MSGMIQGLTIFDFEFVWHIAYGLYKKRPLMRRVLRLTEDGATYNLAYPAVTGLPGEIYLAKCFSTLSWSGDSRTKTLLLTYWQV
jgi:hypothetical protein